MSMNQPLTSDILAHLLNLNREPGSITQRLKRDIKKNIHMDNDHRIIIIKQNPNQIQQESSSYPMEDSSSMISPQLESYPMEDSISIMSPQLESYPMEESSSMMSQDQYQDSPQDSSSSVPLNELIQQQQELIRQQQELITQQQEQLTIYKRESIMSRFISLPKKKHVKTVRFQLPLYKRNKRHKRKTRRATPIPSLKPESESQELNMADFSSNMLKL